MHSGTCISTVVGKTAAKTVSTETFQQQDKVSGYERPAPRACSHSFRAVLDECCFTSAETVGLLGTGAQDGHSTFAQLLSCDLGLHCQMSLSFLA